MKPIYFCFPTKYYLQKDLISKVSKEIPSVLLVFFDDFKVEICSSLSNDVEIYAMGNVKKGKNPVEAANSISMFLGSLNIPEREIKIKTNYESFNPSFNPLVTSSKEVKNISPEEFDYNKLSLAYHSVEPFYSLDNVVLSKTTKQEIIDVINSLKYEKTIYDEWGLRNIIPNALSAVNFYGAPGTGKTMAAEALAKELGKKILKSSYADIESKYVGEGPKMMKAIFKAASRDNAILFIDEADSLLSKRLINVSDGAAQALNSLRSQLLICLDSFEGLVIFSTNLIINYDEAFLSRLINIKFESQDEIEREQIWKVHVNANGVKIPLSSDVNFNKLSKEYVFVGRDIKNAVKKACVHALSNGKQCVAQSDFVFACNQIDEEKNNLKRSCSKDA